ncbi:MAG: hypothetical protein JNL98_24970 [Bryobacterales bacterium]|nr:hypothetical protein [Bryobacterales bacterium]
MTEGLAVAVATVEALVILAVVLELRRRQLEFNHRWLSRSQLIQSEMGRMRSALHDMKRRLDDSEKPATTPHAIGASPLALNVNRRAQAIRMMRRGEHPTQISTALAIPLRQVELLLKVSRIAGQADFLAGGGVDADPAQQRNRSRSGKPH